VAQWHRRGDACLARENLPAVFRGEKAQVEKVTLKSGALDFFARLRRQAKRLRHLTGAGLIVTGCGAYEQDSACAIGIFLLALGLLNALARLEPLERQFEFRIRKAGSGFSCAGTLVVLVVGFPRDINDIRELRLDSLELWTEEALTESTLELVACQLDVSLAGSHSHHVFDREITQA